MIRLVITLILPQVFLAVTAQDSDSPFFAPAFSKLPSELQSYLSAQATGTALADQIIGDYVTEPEATPAAQHAPVYSEPVPFIQGAQSRFLQFAASSVVPDDQRSLLVSIAGVISSDAAKAGLLGSGSPSTGQTGGITSQTSGIASTTATGANTTASSSGGTSSGQASTSGTITQASRPTSSNAAADAAYGMTPAVNCLQLFIMSLVAMFV